MVVCEFTATIEPTVDDNYAVLGFHQVRSLVHGTCDLG